MYLIMDSARDVDELIDAVQRSLDAEQKVTDLNAMKKMQNILPMTVRQN